MSFTFTRKAVLVTTLAVTTALAACGDVHPSYEDPGYLAALERGSQQIAANPNYVRLPIDKWAETEQFSDLTYSLYKGEISKEQFIAQMQALYPDPKYRETIRWNAENFSQ